MSRLLSIDIESGMTKINLYPFTAATIAKPIPVLPDVASIIVLPCFNNPFCSASSIIDKAILSLILAPGLALSSFIQTLWTEPNSLFIFTCGVLPMVSNILLYNMITNLN
ncbi:hypothetical protein D3C80_1211930 [compost metagenome]